MFSKFHMIIFDQINHYFPKRRFNNVSEVTSKTVITKCVESWLTKIGRTSFIRSI